jgi:hypothetical protein
MTDHEFDVHGGHAQGCVGCRIEQAERERDAALAAVREWVAAAEDLGLTSNDPLGFDAPAVAGAWSKLDATEAALRALVQ